MSHIANDNFYDNIMDEAEDNYHAAKIAAAWNDGDDAELEALTGRQRCEFEQDGTPCDNLATTEYVTLDEEDHRNGDACVYITNRCRNHPADEYAFAAPLNLTTRSLI